MNKHHVKAILWFSQPFTLLIHVLAPDVEYKTEIIRYGIWPLASIFTMHYLFSEFVT
ncbi:hypothetical protein AM1_4677 [Acaryochloris marina MBIC11017]|uniref:Uncharacterized protein n=1 Tax=Acaryochloris marina (strain MBIC 11017) TaxID=329726 RepID=B0C1B6_ACAM1|nr:hypothetical protein AM1_4677 [Acaryochloris marina MBIC11017]